MNDLSKHIERLLLDNDCVIVPGLGGFIAYNVSARYVSEENLYLPPMRTIGFNSQLILNDGLLVQSYMQYNDVSYPEALRILEADIDEVKDILQNEGSVDFKGIGILHYTVDCSYTFKSCECGILSPTLYGLSSFLISELRVINKTAVYPIENLLGNNREKIEKIETKRNKTLAKDKHNMIIKMNRKALDYTVAIAASIALFFVFSIPVKNTDVSMENYASLSYSSLFKEIKNKSLVLNVIKSGYLDKVAVKSTSVVAKTKMDVNNKSEEDSFTKSNSKNINLTTRSEEVKVTSVKKNVATPSVYKSASTETIKLTPNKYKVIIASVNSRKMAEYMVSQAASKGYSSAFIVEGKKHFRVAISSYPTLTAAYNKINRLHKDSIFMDAWVLSSDN